MDDLDKNKKKGKKSKKGKKNNKKNKIKNSDSYSNNSSNNTPHFHYITSGSNISLNEQKQDFLPGGQIRVVAIVA